MENTETEQRSVLAIVGPEFELGTLPEPNVTRWLPRHKAAIVGAVNGGLLGIDEACERFDLSLEEFLSWRRAIERAGLAGLRTTHTRQYRDHGPGRND
jgi:hypothetical protein